MKRIISSLFLIMLLISCNDKNEIEIAKNKHGFKLASVENSELTRVDVVRFDENDINTTSNFDIAQSDGFYQLELNKDVDKRLLFVANLNGIEEIINKGMTYNEVLECKTSKVDYVNSFPE